jgi:hypothetical protein
MPSGRSRGDPHARRHPADEEPLVRSAAADSVEVPPPLAIDAVAAHELLNSSAVVSSAIATLRAHWDQLSAAARIHILERMASHATHVDDALRTLILGVSDEPD